MAHRYKKKCLALLPTRETQIRTAMRHQLSSVGMAVLVRQDPPSAGGLCRGADPALPVGSGLFGGRVRVWHYSGACAHPTNQQFHATEMHMYVPRTSV